MLKQLFVGPKAHRDTLLAFKAFRAAKPSQDGLIEEYLVALNSPLSLSIYLLFKAGEFEQIVRKEINPFDYNDADSFRLDFAAISFLRKCPFLKTGIDTRQEALQSFKNSEQQCLDTNSRLLSLPSTDLNATVLGGGLLKKIRRKIRDILGDFNIDVVLEESSWGPGVTTHTKGSNTSPSQKFATDASVTHEAYYLYSDVMRAAYPSWDWPSRAAFCTGNHVVTVPKNAKTDRTIAIEPGINSWIQLGIGRLIRKRLRRAGFNLNSDIPNQTAARLASCNNRLATVDFKAASDTISIELVRLLLPERWFSALDAARSEYYTHDKKTCRFEKFSSMGNGFTFELESLIFLSVALAISDGLDEELVDHICIFGDDLVIPSVVYSKAVEVYDFLGFTVNTQKSFSTGYFRESCGSYYFNGVDVKPIFLKEKLETIKSLYRFANAIRFLAHRHLAMFACDRRFKRLWYLVLQLIPRTLRCFGPVLSGDSTIHVSFSETNARRAPRGLCGNTYTGFVAQPLTVYSDHIGLLLARLRYRSTDSLNNEDPLRGRTKTVLKTRCFCTQWYDFGTWL